MSASCVRPPAAARARAAAARSPRCPPPGMNSHRKAADLRSTLLRRRRHPNPVSRCGRTAVEVFDLSFGGRIGPRETAFRGPPRRGRGLSSKHLSSHSQVTSEAALPERHTACCGERRGVYSTGPRAPFGQGRGHLSGKTSQSAMLASATTPPGFPLVWEGVPTANYTMVGYDAGMLNIQVNA